MLFFTIPYITKRIKLFVKEVIIVGIGMAMMEMGIIQIIAIYTMLPELTRNFLEQVKVVQKDMC